MKKQYNPWIQLGLVLAAGACVLTGWHYNTLFIYLIEHLEYGSNTLLMGSISVFLGAFGGFLIIRLLFPHAENQPAYLLGGWILLVFTFLIVVLKLLMGGMGEQIVPFPILSLGRNQAEWILYSLTPALLFGITLGWLIRRREKQ